MASLVQYGKYGAMNTKYSKTLGYYVKKYVSDNYKLQEESTCTGKISTADKLVVKAQYMICMKKQKVVLELKICYE